MQWTGQTEADLMRLWGEGKTAREIGLVLGATRIAILHKYDRLKKGISVTTRTQRVPFLRRFVAPQPTQGVPLLDLGRGMCRWPYGDGPFLFCGNPVRDERVSYCAGHCCVAFRAEPVLGRVAA